METRMLEVQFSIVFDRIETSDNVSKCIYRQHQDQISKQMEQKTPIDDSERYTRKIAIVKMNSGYIVTIGSANFNIGICDDCCDDDLDGPGTIYWYHIEPKGIKR